MSSNHNGSRARVARTPLPVKSASGGLAAIEGVCRVAAQSKRILLSPPGHQALDDVQAAVKTANGSLASKQELTALLALACKAAGNDAAELVIAVRLYETAVAAVARGNASILRAAGFEPRVRDRSGVFGTVTGMKSKPGTHAMDVLVSWPAVPCAKTYAVEVSYTAGGPWHPAGTSGGRRRLLKGRAPASQLLVRVAAIKADGTRAAWSDPILVTTR
jgi:hypothetical protein